MVEEKTSLMSVAGQLLLLIVLGEVGYQLRGLELDWQTGRWLWAQF